MTHNQRTMEITLKRIDVCDLLIACTVISNNSDSEKWRELHDKLAAQLDEFDKKCGFDK